MQQPYIIDYSTIHMNKENVKPIPQGRTASKLQEIINTDNKILQLQLTKQRQEFENSLDPSILQDLDDPLNSYLQYIKWIRENYPTGNTHESLLIQVLERTTHDFKDDDYYKNEIRYFKIWLEYITYSDHPGDVFNYLLKKKIGCDLSLFYENYSLFFELNDQWENAQEILKLGITNKARPLTRLLKSYDEFILRKTAKSSNSQNSVPLKGLYNSDGSGLNLKSTTDSKSNSLKPNKIQVFNDTAKTAPGSFLIQENDKSSKSPHLDTIKHSQKENTIKPVSWHGETLKNSSKSSEKDSKKIQVFNDKLNQYPITKTVKHQDGKRFETFDFNFDLYMPKNSKPMTMLEVMLQFHKNTIPEIKKNCTSSIDNILDQSRKRSLIGDMSFNTPKKLKIASDVSVEIDDKNTVTNPKKSPGITDTPLLEYFKHSKGRLFSTEEEQQKENKNILAPTLQISDDANTKDDNPNQSNLLDAIICGAFSDIFTDTLTKPLDPTTPPKAVRQDLPQISKDKQHIEHEIEEDDLLSSPFVENPQDDSRRSKPNIVNPFDHSLKSDLSNTIQLFLFQNHNIYNFETLSMNKLSILNKIFKTDGQSIYGNKQALLEFDKHNIFCVTRELGRSKFSAVYLAEKSDGHVLNAIKIKSPSDLWEIYILSKLNQKSNEFINFKSAFTFNDESYLILPYLHQGTALNLINNLSNYHYMTGKNLIEESLVIYFSIQLLNKVIKLHSLGFIHCDIKPENILININNNSNNNNKLKFNNLELIDFGRAIDTSLFSDTTQFQCKFEKTDNQDCTEFVYNLPWRYEPDYYGVANVIHHLLFNKSIITQRTSDGVQLVESFKFYWQRDLWNELFSLLLNPRQFNSTGNISKDLIKVKGKLESWFNLTIDKKAFLEKMRQIAEILNARSKKTKL